jgi:predicted nucleic acid-binding protein
MNAVDTNVFVYAIDVEDPTKQVTAYQLIQELAVDGGSTIILWQVACEFLSNLRRWEATGRITKAKVDLYFRNVLRLYPLVVPTDKVLSVYFELRSRFSLSHWDTILIAACKEAGVTTLYSEDMDHKADYDGVVIVNPFT